MGTRWWILGILAIGAACSSTSELSPATPPSSGETTPATTVATTITPTTTIEVPAATDCVEATATTPGFQFADERVLDTFGPLSETPSLQLKLRQSESPEADVTQRIVTTARIPGGILLSADATADEQALLTAIDADGERRWTRCFDAGFNMFVAPPGDATPTQALVLSYVSQAGLGVVPEWSLIDLASGTTDGALSALFEAQGIDVEGIDGWMLAWSADNVLFGPAQDAAIDVARDHLVLVDLDTMSATAIPFPDSQAGRELFEVQFGFTDAGDLAVVEYDHGLQTPTMVYAQGEWQQGDAVRALLPPVRDGEVVDAGGTPWLVGIDPTGTEMWRVTDISLSNNEGFRHAQSGDVTVMSGCASLIEFVCEQTTAGIDTATGEILWTNADYGGVLAVGDGFALIVTIEPGGGSGSRMMINARTGELADPSQHWSPNEYYQGCCGDESHWLVRNGAVVVARFDDQIDVWYPSAVALPTRTLAIP